MQSVTFPFNTPQLITLESSQSLEIANGRLYQLSDGRFMHLEKQASESLDLLKVEPGEAFYICKRALNPGVYWDIWLTPQSEQYRAVEEIRQETGEDLTPLLVKSLEEVRRRRAGEPEVTTDPPPPPIRKQPAAAIAAASPELRPTGTEAAPLPARDRLSSKPPITARIPFNIAVSEVVAFVTDSLKQAGEQWDDGAKQDLVSTILITAGKQGYLTLWERGAA